MMRHTPMRRNGWSRKPRPEVATGGTDKTAKTLSPATRRASMPPATGGARAITKADPVRSEAYRRLVAALPCCACGLVGHSQAAHPNTGKGGGIKTDDRLCFPLCASRPLTVGCHPRLDQGAWMARDERRAAEQRWATETIQRITEAGLWPPGLPQLQPHEVAKFFSSK